MYSSTAASPRARTSAMIAATAASTAAILRGLERDQRVERGVEARVRRRQAAQGEGAMSCRCTAGVLRAPRAERFDQRLHQRALELERARD